MTDPSGLIAKWLDMAMAIMGCPNGIKGIDMDARWGG